MFLVRASELRDVVNIKKQKGCPDSWWYMVHRNEEKIEYLCCDDDQQQEREKNIEKFIQFEHTVSSSQDHSIISAGITRRHFSVSYFPYDSHTSD